MPSQPEEPAFATDGRPVDPAEFADINARRWDELAGLHAAGDGRFYDTDALVRGENPLWDVERLALDRVAPRGLAGLDVMHLQCHLGANAIHFARQGARVVGLDVSPKALNEAAERAERCGVAIDWVCADASDPPAELRGRFDLVWASIGITSWAPDLSRWMAACAGLLRDGGRLVLIDCHPVYSLFATVEPPTVDFPYGGGARLAFSAPGSYDDPEAPVVATEAANAAWNLADHINAAVGAGLSVDHLDEHLSTEHDPRGLLPVDEDGRSRLRLGPGQAPLPLLFTLIARYRGARED